MKTIVEIIAEVNAAKLAIKSLAVEARVAAPKGQKMAYGQHASAVQSSKVATATLDIIAKRGFVAAAVAAKVSKTGRVEFAVTYREPQSLEQRVTTMVNAAARRKAARDAKAAAKNAAIEAAKPKVPSMMDTAKAAATNALGTLDQLLNGGGMQAAA